MPVGTLLLALLLLALAIVMAIAVAPALTSLVGAGRLRKELASEKRDKRIAYRALREIMAQNGDGAALIAEIAVSEIDSNEIKELN